MAKVIGMEDFPINDEIRKTYLIFPTRNGAG